MRPTIFALILVFATAGSAVADTRITANLQPKKITMYENTTLEVSVESDNKDVPQPQLPPLTDFQVFSSGRSQRVNIVNGKASSSVTYSYVLVPRKPGRFSVGPATVVVDGVTYSSSVEQITVNDALPPPPSQRGRPSEDPASVPAQRRAHHVFITATLNDDTVYLNQPVTYIFRFYSGERLLSNPEYQRPSFTGFWVEDLPPQRKFSTTVNGVPYEVTEIRTALFPADAGTKTIPAAEVQATVRSQRRQGRRNPFNLFDDSFFDRGEPLRLSTEALTLVVLPPPTTGITPAPSGLVGEFQIKARADLRQVNVGDPITVSVTVAGEGNVKSIPRPYRDTIPSFRMFSGGTSEKVSTLDYKISGWKAFDEVFVPQRAGTYNLPSFALTYFDPVKEDFTTIRTEPIEITVTGGAADFTIPSLRLEPDQLSDLAADVRFLKTDGADLRRATGTSLFGAAFWIGHILPLAGLVGFVTWRKRVLKESADPIGRRRRRARQIAIARLRGVDGKSATALTFDDLSASLEQFFADRYNTHPQGQTRSEMRAVLTGDGVPEDTVAAYLNLLDMCDRSRYAPGGMDKIPEETIAAAERVIGAIGDRR